MEPLESFNILTVTQVFAELDINTLARAYIELDYKLKENCVATIKDKFLQLHNQGIKIINIEQDDNGYISNTELYRQISRYLCRKYIVSQLNVKEEEVATDYKCYIKVIYKEKAISYEIQKDKVVLDRAILNIYRYVAGIIRSQGVHMKLEHAIYLLVVYGKCIIGDITLVINKPTPELLDIVGTFEI